MEIHEYIKKYAEDIKEKMEDSTYFSSSPKTNPKWAEDAECVLYIALDQYQAGLEDYLSEASQQISKEMDHLARSIEDKYPDESFEDWVFWAYWTET